MDDNEKDVKQKEQYVDAAPMYAMSFQELFSSIEAEKSARDARELGEQFQVLSKNIIDFSPPEEIEQRLVDLSSEYSTLLTSIMSKKERWQPLTDAVKNKLADLISSKEVSKTEGGVKYPASDFAYVPDKTKPSTWKLRLAEGSPGNITVAQLGRAAAALSSGGFRGNKVQLPSDAVAKVKERIRSEYKKLGVDDIPDSVKKEVSGGSFILKEQADGSYRWLAIYSNKYKDRDAEIISDASHRRFAKMVDKGEVPYPELWYWHVPGSRWGVSDFHAYDSDAGFAVAAGAVDKGMEHVARAVKERGGLLVSHGMPKVFLEYDKDDPKIITKHITIEVSPLPAEKAANQLTSFNILSEDTDMALKKEKKEELAALGFDVDAIEEAIATKAKEASELELQFKEQSEEDEAETNDKESVVDDVVEQVQNDGISREELNAVVAEIGAAIKSISDVVTSLTKEIEEIKEKEADEPVFDLRDIFQSAIGTKEAKVDKRSALAKDEPEHNKEHVQSVTGVSFLDNLMNS